MTQMTPVAKYSKNGPQHLAPINRPSERMDLSTLQNLDINLRSSDTGQLQSNTA